MDKTVRRPGIRDGYDEGPAFHPDMTAAAIEANFEYLGRSLMRAVVATKGR